MKKKIGKTMKLIECHNEKCKYKWWSKTKLKRVACPSCGYKVNVEKQTIKEVDDE